MEESPKRTDASNNESSEDIEGYGKKNILSPTQQFLMKWRRMNEKSQKNNLESSAEDQQDEDEEDDDDETSHSIKKLNREAKRRYRKIKNKLFILMPRVEDVKVAEHTKVQASEEVDQDNLSDNDTSQQLEDAPQDLIEEFYENHQIIEREVIDEDSLSNSEAELKNSDPNQQNMSLPPVAEPESIETIIQRRNNQNLYHALQIQQASIEADNNTRDAERASTESVQTVTTIENNNVRQTGNTLAVDYLNYQIIKKRDIKNMKIDKQAQNKINESQARLNDRFDTYIKQEKRHKDHMQFATEHIQEKNEPQLHKTTLHNHPERSRQPVAKSPENSPRNSYQVSKEIEHLNIDETRAAVNFEHTLQQVIQAEGKGIINEFQYERRHEVKDVASDIKDYRGLAIELKNKQFDKGTDKNHQQISIKPNKNSAIKQKNIIQKFTQDDAYKQAVSTGFWAAIVGIALFIIIYMLGS